MLSVNKSFLYLRILSCFGPFKESSCVPNFIEDRSFEEIRWGFIESNKNGTVQQYLTNLMNEYNMALSKLNELKLPSNDTIQLIASIYNSSNNDQKSPSNNPFGTGIFGSANSNQSTMSASSIFGSGNSAVTSNPFQQSSIFGGNTSALTKPSVFAKNNIFSSTTPASSQAPSIFGGVQHQQQQPTQSIFGQSTFSSMAQTNTPTSVFGASSMQQQNTTGQPSIFNMNSFTQNTMEASATPQSTIFSSNVSNAFQQQPAQQQASIFGQVQNNAPQQASNNIFGSVAISEPQLQNIFGIQSIPPQQPPPQQQQQQPINTSASSIFSIQSSSNLGSSVFGGNPFQPQIQLQVSESAYTKPENLTAEEIQYFQSSSPFPIGKIPTKPPPRNLI